ncbi:GntR family transcriptional regulator [Porphyromonadaceae bacterium]
MDIDQITKSIDIDSFFHSREKLVDGVFNALRHMITTQKIKVGERLDYKELGSLLKVSRVPIREAVQRLEAAGLLDVKKSVGTYVVELSAQEIKDIFGFRLMLETQSLREGFDRISIKKLKNLKSIFNEEAGSVKRDPEYLTTDGIKEADEEFHNLIIECAASRVISRLYKQIEGFILILRNLNRREYISSQEHVAIIDAILAKDLDAALDLLSRHLCSVRDTTILQ